MTRKRKRPEQASSKSVVPFFTRPQKKRKLGTTTVDSLKPNPIEPSEGSHKPDIPVSPAPEPPKAPPPKSAAAPAKPKRRPKIVKLAPVAFLGNALPGSNPTGPWSQRGEGKNKLAITRKLELGAYLRLCVELINVDGYRKIYLSAMGAAIAHALLLTTSLPAVLAPTFAPSDIKTTIVTGTMQCIDEVIPDEKDEDEDEGGMQVRQKSCINIDIIIGNGERVEGATVRKGPKSRQKKAFRDKGKDGKND